jgi:hypothetical protein
MSDVDPVEIVDTAAQGPSEAADDTGRMKEQPLGDLLKWEDRRLSDSAVSKNHMGIRRVKLRGPGGNG